MPVNNTISLALHTMERRHLNTNLTATFRHSTSELQLQNFALPPVSLHHCLPLTRSSYNRTVESRLRQHPPMTVITWPTCLGENSLWERTMSTNSHLKRRRIPKRSRVGRTTTVPFPPSRLQQRTNTSALFSRATEARACLYISIPHP